MQLNTFVQEYYQNPKEKPLLKRVGGMLPVSKNVFNDEIMHQKVDTAVNAIHIQQIASHLGIELEDVQHAAVEVCGMKQEARLFEKKVQDFDARENAYMNGSVLEKARRWIGSDPVDPRSTVKGEQQPIINIQLPEELVGGGNLQERVQRNEQAMQDLSTQMASLLSALESQFQAKQTEAETSEINT